MAYTYKYPRPALTVDIILLKIVGQSAEVLLIQRKNDPFKGMWAFPGGFMDIDESTLSAAYRELEEETGIKDVKLNQFSVFDAVGRDPRGRTVSVVYYGIIKKEGILYNSVAGDDASRAEWFNVNELNELAFDHMEILEKFSSKVLGLAGIASLRYRKMKLSMTRKKR